MQSDRTSELEQYHQYHNQEEEGIYHHPEPDDPSAHPVEYATEPSGIENSAATGGLFSAGACIKCHDFSVVDTHAAQFPRQYVRSLDELAYNLTEPFTYETEKARAIFTWLHHNIQYDAQSFFAGTVKPATPESTLSSGLAVCEGYAGLFVYLAEKSGLQVYKVSGHGKGFGYRDLAPGEPTPKMSSNHAWNCVLMDGEWRLIDATWGAGALNGSTYEQRFDASWFTANSVEFARRHFPTDPTFQLIPDEDGGPLGWEDYILTPPGPVIFGDFYRLNFLVDLLQPATNVITSGQTVTFTLFKRCEHMTNHDADNYVYVLIIPGSKPLPLEPTAEGGWSSTYQIMNTTEVSLMFISTVNGQDAKGIGIRGFRNALDRKAMSFGGLAKWTVTS
jgi:transglutaminase-like putative cysteine protease